MEWVSVEDRLPDDNHMPFLVICADDVSEYSHPYTYQEACWIAFYSKGVWWDEKWCEKAKEDNIIEDVTHWMPLREPPEGK